MLALMLLSLSFDKGATSDTSLHASMMLHVSMAKLPQTPVHSPSFSPAGCLSCLPVLDRTPTAQVATAQHVLYLFADPWIPVRFTPWGSTVQIIRYVRATLGFSPSPCGSSSHELPRRSGYADGHLWTPLLGWVDAHHACADCSHG